MELHLTDLSHYLTNQRDEKDLQYINKKKLRNKQMKQIQKQLLRKIYAPVV